MGRGKEGVVGYDVVGIGCGWGGRDGTGRSLGDREIVFGYGGDRKNVTGVGR